MTDRMLAVLRVLNDAGKPLTGNEIAYACGFRSGSDRLAHDGRSVAVSNRTNFSVQALERLGFVGYGRRRDGLSGSAHVITAAGREALQEASA